MYVCQTPGKMTVRSKGYCLPGPPSFTPQKCAGGAEYVARACTARAVRARPFGKNRQTALSFFPIPVLHIAAVAHCMRKEDGPPERL